jgi:hypothetical protein
MSKLFSILQKKKTNNTKFSELLKRKRRTYFVSKWDEIAKGVDRFLTQSEVNWASTIPLIDLIHIQFLNFGCKIKQKNQKGHQKIQSRSQQLGGRTIDKEYLLDLSESDDGLIWLLQVNDLWGSEKIEFSLRDDDDDGFRSWKEKSGFVGE